MSTDKWTRLWQRGCLAVMAISLVVICLSVVCIAVDSIKFAVGAA